MTIRLWSAVMVYDIPQCLVEDVEGDGPELDHAFDNTRADKRAFGAQVIGAHAEWLDRGLVSDACSPHRCRPGCACPEHQARAYSWWSEWAKRYPAALGAK